MTKPGKLVSPRTEGRAVPAPDAQRDHPSGYAVEKGPINILIVDDEPANLVVLETVLEDPGYRLVRAESPQQALLALVEEEFALLILDIRMPGMTGFELAKMIKQRRKTADVPIIFLTAYYDKDQHEVEGYETGAVDFLSKPVNPAVLRSKVAVFADLHRKTRAISQVNGELLAEVLERRRAEEQLRDLTETLERRVVERTEELRQTDRRLRSVLSSITDGLMMLDLRWCCTYFNAPGARMLGMHPEQLLGGCIWDLLPHMRGSKFFEGFHRAVEQRETIAFEAYYPLPLGIWLECHCYPTDDGLWVYFHDITDRRDVEARREQLLDAEQAARSESERLARAKDEFLASLSHELRTPLGAIMGWTRVLMRGDADAETLRRGIDAIARNARAQTHLVSDLLDVSRIVAGKLRLSIERMDLNLVATVSADNVRPAAQTKGVSVDIRLAESSPLEIMGDTIRMQQIASNLVVNAVKFTPAGGAVSIATAVNGAHAEFTVTDTGQGIAADFLPRLFDRFSQADASHARAHGGLGLGLAIVKNLVELHAGSVTASSAGAGRGATFTVRIPLAANAPAQATDGPDVAAVEAVDGFSVSGNSALGGPIDLQGVSVLIVDDHVDLLSDECRLLGDCGALVTATSSAEEALHRLTAERFDVLLSDLGMPGMDGYGLINTVRSVLGLDAAQLPAAAVTGYVRVEDRQRALREGYQVCLQRPVSPTALARTVLDLVQGQRTADTPTEPRDRPPGLRRSPAAPAQAPAQRAIDAPPQSAHKPRLRALFVEDNLDLQEQIGWQLEAEGLDLVTCASGEAAELEFGKGGFDVVVTDISLPGMSGVEFARRVLARSPQTWLVFSTGFPLPGSLSEFGPHVRVLLKPFEADELHGLMEEVRAWLSAQPSTLHPAPSA